MKVAFIATIGSTILASTASAGWGGPQIESMPLKWQALVKQQMCSGYVSQVKNSIALCSEEEMNESCFLCSLPTDQESIDCYIEQGCLPQGSYTAPRRLRHAAKRRDKFTMPEDFKFPKDFKLPEGFRGPLNEY